MQAPSCVLNGSLWSLARESLERLAQRARLGVFVCELDEQLARLRALPELKVQAR